MKHSILIALCSFFILTNCSIGDDDNNNQNNIVYKTYWHLVNTSGGVSGVNQDFDLNEVVWSFDEGTMELTVVNDNEDGDKEDAFDSGTYDYSVTEDDPDSFLFIDGSEFGSFTITTQELVIDQNTTTAGTATDGFEYTFERVLVAQELDDE